MTVLEWNIEMFSWQWSRTATLKSCLTILPKSRSSKWRLVSCPASSETYHYGKICDSCQVVPWLFPTEALTVLKTAWKIHTTGRGNRTTRNFLQMSGLFKLNCRRSWFNLPGLAPQRAEPQRMNDGTVVVNNHNHKCPCEVESVKIYLVYNLPWSWHRDFNSWQHQ